MGFRLGPRLGALVSAVATVPGPGRDPLAVRFFLSQYAVTNMIFVMHFSPKRVRIVDWLVHRVLIEINPAGKIDWIFAIKPASILVVVSGAIV